MTEKEFEHITSVKTQLDRMKDFAYGPDYLECKRVKIIRLIAMQDYKHTSNIKEVEVPPDISDEIMNIIKKRLEKLQEEFDNFKI